MASLLRSPPALASGAAGAMAATTLLWPVGILRQVQSLH